MNALDLPLTRLNEDSLCTAAMKDTGLSDFGDPYFREGLRELLESCRQDANLHAIGRLVVRDMITTFLIQRLKMVEARKQEPEIFNLPLAPPLIVTGMARSGTTFLHKDGNFTCGLGRFTPAEWTPPAEVPDADYPFVLSTGRTLYNYNIGNMTRKNAPIAQKEDSQSRRRKKTIASRVNSPPQGLRSTRSARSVTHLLDLPFVSTSIHILSV